MRWAKKYCKHYEGERPKVKNTEKTEIRNISPENKSVSIEKKIVPPHIELMKKKIGKYFEYKKYGIGIVLDIKNNKLYVEFPDYDTGIKGTIEYKKDMIFYDKNPKNKISNQKKNKNKTVNNNKPKIQTEVIKPIPTIGMRINHKNISLIKKGDYIYINNFKKKIMATSKMNIILTDGTLISYIDNEIAIVKIEDNIIFLEVV